ncbi:MAG: spermidine synthase [Bacteroidia bacterium]
MHISWYKYILSYFYLVTIKKIPSEINPGLCLQMEAGKLLLNTTNANYSYGNLHKVFEEVFVQIEIETKPPQNVLLLGLGTGSVIDIMQRQYGFEPQITAIELDPAIIDCLKYWDNLDLNKTNIICGDAFTEINNLKPGFDLIIVDLFIDMDVHPDIHKMQFINKLQTLVAEKGTILINYIVNTKKQKEQFAEFQILLINYFKEITGHEVMGMNRVLELKKS